jgi:hypothetical protein
MQTHFPYANLPRTLWQKLSAAQGHGDNYFTCLLKRALIHPIYAVLRFLGSRSGTEPVFPSWPLSGAF